MKKYLAITLTIFLFVIVNQPSAEASTDPNQSTPQEVVEGMSEKMVRGLANILTGWVEFPKQIIVTAEEDGITKGLTVGILKGLGMTVVRTVIGVGEVVTFYHPSPDFYGPYFDPEFVWESEHPERAAYPDK